MNRRHVFLLSAIVVVGLVVAACYQPTQFIPKFKVIDVVGRDTLKTFLGLASTNNNIKIVFTKKEGSRNLYFVDYSDPIPHATKLKKPVGLSDKSADSPLIDSSGTFITYYLATESGVYIQKLDSTADPVLIADIGTEPHWYKDRALGKTYIIYSNYYWTQKNTLATLSGYATFKQEVSLSDKGSKIGPAVPIANKPFNGGISIDGTYLCTGNSDAAFYNLTSSLYTPVNVGQQTCNPSISTDPAHPDRMMFLNFLGPQFMDTSLISIGDAAIDQHEYIFIVGANNRLYTSIHVPSGYAEWQDPEWSNNPNFAAALGEITKDEYAGLIVNLTTKATIVVTPGDNKLDVTSTPYIWIGN